MKVSKLMALVTSALILAVPTAVPAAKPLPAVESFDLAEALKDPALAKDLPEGVKFYFGDQKAAVVRVIGPVKGSRRTGLGRDSSVSCRKALGSLMGALARDVQARGGNALIAVQSNLFNRPTSSNTQFRCAIGGKKVSVALTGQAAVVE